jgi:hypothetical protein
MNKQPSIFPVLCAVPLICFLAPVACPAAPATLDDTAAITPIDQIFVADAIGWARDLTGLRSYPRHRSDGPA